MPARPAKIVCEKCGGKLVAGSRFCNQCGAPAPATSPFEVDESAAASPIRPGDVLEGKWRVEKKVGQGGMGSVYRATDLALDRTVAVKVLAAELCKDEVFVARFEREAKLTAGLEQPNVVLIYGVGRHLGRPFIVMKWLAGETLSRRMETHQDADTRMPIAEVRSIVAQICAGLDYIHGKGLVHRDIKASNIILGEKNHATILDFGILRDLKSKESLTAVGMLIGTPHYVSPEQILGRPFDNRSDLYAVGVLLYEMLTGATPFDADNEFDLIKKHVKQAPPEPCERNPDLPSEVGEVLKRAIAKDPAKRFQTATDLAEAFEQAFAESEAPTARALPVAKPRPEGPTIPPPVEPDITAPMQTGSRRALWVGVGLGVLASVVTAAIVLLNVRPDPPPPTPPPARPIAPVQPVAKPSQATPPKTRPAAQDDSEQLGPDEEWVEETDEAAAGAPNAAAGDTGGGASGGPVATGVGEGDEGGADAGRDSLLKKAVQDDPSKLVRLRDD